MRIKAPFSSEQVEALNRWQKNGHVHPFTCGNKRNDTNHTGGEGVLIATTDGWICPFCSYQQDWAYDFMVKI